MPLPNPTEFTNVLMGLPMTHRFSVTFLHAGVLPNLIDIRFQEVLGVAAKVLTKENPSLSPSLSSSKIPIGIEYGDLVLRRGVVIGSVLSQQVAEVFRTFRFFRSDILVTVLSESAIPIGAWMFSEAYPVEWQLGDLNAMEEKVLIESLSLTYSKLRWITL